MLLTWPGALGDSSSRCCSPRASLYWYASQVGRHPSIPHPVCVWLAGLSRRTGPCCLVSAAFNFLVTYVVDKYLLLHFYQTPPMYDASLAHMVSSFLPWAFVVHLFMSTWILSSPELMPSGTMTRPGRREGRTRGKDVSPGEMVTPLLPPPDRNPRCRLSGLRQSREWR